MSNIMRRLLFIFTLVAFVNGLIGQVRYFDERYVSSLSYLNPVLVNPGATGAEGTHQIIANYRNKWATFPDSPKSFIISYDGAIADNLGFGAQFLTDRNGSLTTSKVQGALSYTIETAANKLGVGLSGEYIKHGLDSDVATHSMIDPNDVLIIERLAGNGFFDVSVGVYGVYDNTITYGLALPSLVSSRIDDNTNEVHGTDFGYIVNLGYIYRRDEVIFEPSVFVKQLNNVPFHADINLLARFVDDKLRGGISYTVGADEKVGFLVGTRFNTLSFNYGYNISRNEFQTYNNGSHELSVRFDIGGDRSKGMDADMEMDKMKKEEGLIEEVIQEGINN